MTASHQCQCPGYSNWHLAVEWIAVPLAWFHSVILLCASVCPSDSWPRKRNRPTQPIHSNKSKWEKDFVWLGSRPAYFLIFDVPATQTDFPLWKFGGDGKWGTFLHHLVSMWTRPMAQRLLHTLNWQNSLCIHSKSRSFSSTASVCLEQLGECKCWDCEQINDNESGRAYVEYSNEWFALWRCWLWAIFDMLCTCIRHCHYSSPVW